MDSNTLGYASSFKETAINTHAQLVKAEKQKVAEDLDSIIAVSMYIYLRQVRDKRNVQEVNAKAFL